MASVGTQYSLLSEDAEARRVLEEAYKLSRDVPEPGVRATASCYLAGVLVRNGELDRAEAMFQEGMRELPDEPQFAFARVECLSRGSQVAQEHGDGQQGMLASKLPASSAKFTFRFRLAASGDFDRNGRCLPYGRTEFQGHLRV